MSFFKRLSIAAVLLSVGVLSASASVSAVSSGGIGGRPANPDPNNPRTQSIFILNVDKGEEKKDVILVANNSDKAQTVEIYAVDGMVTNTGAYTCSQQSEAKQAVGAWTKISKDTVTLQPGKTEEVDFILTMPATADVGEHNGCIVFQVAADEGEASGNVRIRTRQAIRLVATVPGVLERNVEISNFSTGLDDGKQVYTLNLKNTGNVSADVDAKVYLRSIFGNVVEQNGGGYPVLANQKLDLTFIDETRPFFGGWYHTYAEVIYDDRAGTFGTGDSAHLTKKATERELIFVAPTLAGGMVLIAILGFVGGLIAWLLLKRYRRLNVLKTWHKYPVAQGDSIQSVATKHSISWKKLASVNGISAPYVLNKGDIVRVPVESKKTSARQKNQ